MRAFRRTSLAILFDISERSVTILWRPGMSTLEIDFGALRPRSVEFTATELVVTLVDGRRIATPLDWYPRLKAATDQQRANFEIMTMGIHWPDISADLGVVGMLKGRPV